MRTRQRVGQHCGWIGLFGEVDQDTMEDLSAFFAGGTSADGGRVP
jgi:hypothetical protein